MKTKVVQHVWTMLTGDDSDCGLQCCCPAMAAAGMGGKLDDLSYNVTKMHF